MGAKAPMHLYLCPLKRVVRPGPRGAGRVDASGPEAKESPSRYLVHAAMEQILCRH
jgi:hypothetical protein